MAELSKLLAFMFKEDKEDILAQYNKMLDEAEDEQAMLESFGSPTKLAVTISRTYNRAERKLAVASDAKDGAAAEQTEAVSAPVPAAPKAPEAKPEAKAPEAGMSYADIIEEIRREKAEAEGIEYKPIFFNEPEPAPIAPEAEEPVEEPEEAAEEQVEAESEPEESEEAADTEKEAEEPAPAEEEAEPESEEEEQEQPEEAEDAAEAEPEAEEQPEEEPEESEEAEEPEEPEEPEEAEEEELSTEDDLILAQLESEPVPVPETQYKTNVALLILYLIFAIPIGVALLAADIIAALVIMIVVIAAIKLAVQFIAFAFSSLAIFADIMLCSGAVLIALAVALLLIWLVVLLLLCGLKGIVRGALSLGRRMCVREVTVNE